MAGRPRLVIPEIIRHRLSHREARSIGYIH
nr:MAG TPA: hypothetical protein [Bacteriophage sp.]